LLWAQAASYPQEVHICAFDLGAKGRVHDDCVRLYVLLLLQVAHIAQHKVYLRQKGRSTCNCISRSCNKAQYQEGRHVAVYNWQLQATFQNFTAVTAVLLLLP
jgi:hypothetical protein